MAGTAESPGQSATPTRPHLIKRGWGEGACLSGAAAGGALGLLLGSILSFEFEYRHRKPMEAGTSPGTRGSLIAGPARCTVYSDDFPGSRLKTMRLLLLRLLALIFLDQSPVHCLQYFRAHFRVIVATLPLRHVLRSFGGPSMSCAASASIAAFNNSV